MKLIVDKTEKIFPKKEIFIDSVAIDKKYGVVFEIEDSTAYFYALDLNYNQQKIQDALHIYNINSITDGEAESIVKIDWSEDYRYSILIINDYPHAIFDFKEKQGYCRTGFPKGPSSSGWSKKEKSWDETILNEFRK